MHVNDHWFFKIRDETSYPTDKELRTVRCHGIAEFVTVHNCGKSWSWWEVGLRLEFGEAGSPVGARRGTPSSRGGSEVTDAPPRARPAGLVHPWLKGRRGRAWPARPRRCRLPGSCSNPPSRWERRPSCPHSPGPPPGLGWRRGRRGRAAAPGRPAGGRLRPSAAPGRWSTPCSGVPWPRPLARPWGTNFRRAPPSRQRGAPREREGRAGFGRGAARGAQRVQRQARIGPQTSQTRRPPRPNPLQRPRPPATSARAWRQRDAGGRAPARLSGL